MLQRPAVRVALSWIGSGIVGSLAFGSLSLLMSPGSMRDVALLVIWPLAIISATVIAWRALGPSGSPSRDRAYVALTEVIEAGESLVARMRQVTATEATPEERQPWTVRTEDWSAEVKRVLAEVAPARLGAFSAEMIWTTIGPRTTSAWIADEITDLELRIERVRQVRGSL
jgi:hypothetical protein